MCECNCLNQVISEVMRVCYCTSLHGTLITYKSDLVRQNAGRKNSMKETSNSTPLEGFGLSRVLHIGVKIPFAQNFGAIVFSTVNFSML